MTITRDSPLMGAGGSIAEARAGLVGLSQVENDWSIVAERYTLGVDQWPFERVPVLRAEEV